MKRLSVTLSEQDDMLIRRLPGKYLSDKIKFLVLQLKKNSEYHRIEFTHGLDGFAYQMVIDGKCYGYFRDDGTLMDYYETGSVESRYVERASKADVARIR